MSSYKREKYTKRCSVKSSTMYQVNLSLRLHPKGEKADSVYPGYGGDPEDPYDPEDTTRIRRIHRIHRRSRGYIGNPNDPEY